MLIRTQTTHVRGSLLNTILASEINGTNISLTKATTILYTHGTGRERAYLPTLGRFAQEDPMGYIDGPSTYQAELSDPINSVDPSGTVDINFNGSKWRLFLTNEHPTFVTPAQARQLGFTFPKGCVSDIDLGPHLHDLNSGEKFFPNSAVVLTKDGSYKPSGNKMDKAWQEVQQSQKFQKALVRAGVLGLLLLLSLSYNEACGEKQALVNRIRENLTQLSQANRPDAERRLAIDIIVDGTNKLFGKQHRRHLALQQVDRRY